MALGVNVCDINTDKDRKDMPRTEFLSSGSLQLTLTLMCMMTPIPYTLVFSITNAVTMPSKL